mmetsp:Transcript_25949/g.47851  ORF Transcript_25949/g.47851 Transcript_25949/m.47851 type:complete len:206 (+) Transcript_25949:302-919(+)
MAAVSRTSPTVCTEMLMLAEPFAPVTLSSGRARGCPAAVVAGRAARDSKAPIASSTQPMRVEGQPAASASAALPADAQGVRHSSCTTMTSASTPSSTSRCAARSANSLHRARHGSSASEPERRPADLTVELSDLCLQASATGCSNMLARVRTHPMGSAKSLRPTPMSPAARDERRMSASRRWRRATSFESSDAKSPVSPQPAKSG